MQQTIEYRSLNFGASHDFFPSTSTGYLSNASYQRIKLPMRKATDAQMRVRSDWYSQAWGPPQLACCWGFRCVGPYQCREIDRQLTCRSQYPSAAASVHPTLPTMLQNPTHHPSKCGAGVYQFGWVSSRYNPLETMNNTPPTKYVNQYMPHSTPWLR